MKTKMFSLAMVFALIMALVMPIGVLAAPPANDDFDNATIIGQFPFYDAISTSEATVNVDDPYCVGQAVTVWYKFTAAANTTIVADTRGSSYDTTLSVYTGTRGALNQITCNDDYYGLQSFVQFPTSAGETYYFMVSQFGTGGSGGSMVLTVNELIPPVNDDVDSAIPVTPLPFTDTRDTSAATTAFDDPYCAYRNASVWYAFSPDTNMTVDLDTTGSNYYADVSVWTGPRSAWGYVNCGYSQHVRFTAVAGQTYYIMVSTYNTSGGTLVLSANEVAVPINDDVDHAIAINSLPFTDTRNTAYATTAGDDPYYCGYNGASVWYSFTPTANTRIELDSSASNYYTVISVWTGPRGAWSNVNCNYSNHIRFDAMAGQTYYIMVGTWGSGGNLSFSATLAPPPLAIDVSIDPIGSVKTTTGVATVKGSVTCNQATFVDGWGYVQQKVGKGIIQGYVYFYVNCMPGTTSAWSSTIYSQPVQEIGKGRAATLFTAGKATAYVSAFAWSPNFNEYASDNATLQVTLRGGQQSYP